MDISKFKFSSEELAKMIDQTLLKPNVSQNDFEQFCKESAKYQFKMIAINSAPVKMCKAMLKGSGVLVGAAISFPLGQTTVQTKVFETSDAIMNGADEIDYVVNIVELKSGNIQLIEDEMTQIVKVCRDNKVTSKVIFENCYLTEEEKGILCKVALNVGPDFIKTSTGFGQWGATTDDVKYMKKMVGDKIKVKAAGGIKNLETALAMIEAGAERIGTSAGTAIVDEYRVLSKQ